MITYTDIQLNAIHSRVERSMSTLQVVNVLDVRPQKMQWRGQIARPLKNSRRNELQKIIN